MIIIIIIIIIIIQNIIRTKHVINRRLNARGSQVHFDDFSGVFLFYNKRCIGNNLNLILNDGKVIGLYLKTVNYLLKSLQE